MPLAAGVIMGARTNVKLGSSFSFRPGPPGGGPWRLLSTPYPPRPPGPPSIGVAKQMPGRKSGLPCGLCLGGLGVENESASATIPCSLSLQFMRNEHGHTSMYRTKLAIVSRFRCLLRSNPLCEMLSQHCFDRSFAMPKLPPLPPMRYLRTFESAGRLGGFSAAAGELHTTQSAVSRTIKDLEHLLRTKLFDRIHRGVRLTRKGQLYHEEITAVLDRIGTAGAILADDHGMPVVIAASNTISMLFLLPLRQELYRAVGEADTHVHVLTCDVYVLDGIGEEAVDLVLTYDPGPASGDRALAFRQEVRPMCAPGYAREHSDILDRPIQEWKWGDLTILDGARRSLGWAKWDDWFEATGSPRGKRRAVSYFDYMFLLEDAIAGKGLALGCWSLLKSHLRSGMLVAVGDGFVEIDRPFYVRLTERGRIRHVARQCFDFFREHGRHLDRP